MITLSPKEEVRALFPPKTKRKDRRRALFLTSLGRWLLKRKIKGAAASLTVEGAVVLPVFLICMLSVMQFLNVYNAACRLSSALTESSEEMAMGAYAAVYGGDDDHLLQAALGIGYASIRVRGKAGDLSALQNTNFLMSSFLTEGDMIHLICTYRPKNIAGMVRLPWIVFLQRGSVRAWTGRRGSDGKEKEPSGSGAEEKTVYVTEHGSVYHKDADCTHIRLSIRTVSKAKAMTSHNRYGARYTPCEHCGRAALGSVYITTEGNRYHSSLECSGLKRTVREVKESDIGHMRACSRCGGA